jgi:hypothetical protein
MHEKEKYAGEHRLRRVMHARQQGEAVVALSSPLHEALGLGVAQQRQHVFPGDAEFRA